MSFLKIIFLILFINGCSVKPLFKDCENNTNIDVVIKPEQTKDSYILEKHLIQLLSSFNIKHNKLYTLKVEINKDKNNIAIYTDETVGREEIIYECKYELIEHSTNKTIIKDRIIISDSYNALFSASNIIQSTYGSEDNILEKIAQKICTHIGITLNAN